MEQNESIVERWAKRQADQELRKKVSRQLVTQVRRRDLKTGKVLPARYDETTITAVHFKNLYVNDGPPIAGIAQPVKHAGFDRSKIYVGLRSGGRELRANNLRSELHRLARVIRKQEREALDAVDKQISELHAIRARLMQVAWKNGRPIAGGLILDAAKAAEKAYQDNRAPVPGQVFDFPLE